MDSASAFQTLSGIDLLRALISGEVRGASMAGALNFRLVEVGEGRALFEGEPDARHLNPLGLVHGGWALTLVDSACGCAAHTLLGPGVGYTSVETKANFTRAIRADHGTIRAEGRVLVAGRRIITTEATLSDREARVVAHGTSTIMVLDPR